MKKIIFLFLIFFASYNIYPMDSEELDIFGDILQDNIIDLPEDFTNDFFSTKQDRQLEETKSSIVKAEALKYLPEKTENQLSKNFESKSEEKDTCRVTKPKKSLCKPKKNKNTKFISNRGSKRRTLVQCPYCDYKRDNYSVNRHIRAKHTKEFSFKCDLCGKGWSDKSNVFKHKLNIHLVCSKCNLKFETKEDMFEHKEKNHSRKK